MTTRNLTDHPLAALLYAVIASPDVSISGLTSVEIQGIFTGHITNWSQVGGPNEAISVLLPPPTAAINAILRTFVMNGMAEKARGLVMKRDRPDILAQYVSQTPGAISYVPLAVANTASVQTLSIDGVAPSTQALLAGTYQFWSVEHLYTEGNGTSQAQAFLQFAERLFGSHIESLGVHLVDRIGHLPHLSASDQRDTRSCSIANIAAAARVDTPILL